MATSIRPVLGLCDPRPLRLLKAMRAILVPGLGPPARPDGAKASKRSHLSDRATCTDRGSRGRLRPERRLVLGFSWSRNCGVFAWAPYKGSTRLEGILAVRQAGRPPQTKKSAPESPSHRPRAAAATQFKVAGARDAQTRLYRCCNTKNTAPAARQRSSGPPDAAAAPPHRCAALDGRRESKHTKSREARAVAATSDEDGHQLIQKFAHAQA